MRIMALPAVRSGGAPISSSRIRRLVQHGALAEARQLLGRDVELSGRVVHGVGRASRLGFPTANLKLHTTLLPPHGVYRVLTKLQGRLHEGLMNLGTRPTFPPTGRTGGYGDQLVCEVHLPRFRGRLYGHTITLSLLEYLRRERRFPHREALVHQIRRDLRRVKFLP
jgi:riboflavin kinase/FMN adenylyltransferase